MFCFYLLTSLTSRVEFRLLAFYWFSRAEQFKDDVPACVILSFPRNVERATLGAVDVIVVVYIYLMIAAA